MPITFTHSLKATWAAFGEDKAMRLASAIAFSAIFSIAPLFIVLIAIVGYIIGVAQGGHGHHVAENALIGQITNATGKGTGDAVRGMISAAFDKPRAGIVAQIVGWIAFAFGASALFSALQDALNAVWHVETTKGGWKQMLRDRAASFVMILIVGFLLLLSVVLNVGIGFAQNHANASFGFLRHPLVTGVVSQLLTVAIGSVIFGALFKILPDVSVHWRDVTVGAVATAVLFVLGENAIAFYFRVAGSASAYGAAGSLLVVLLWIYYTSILVLLGAEFTKVHAGNVATTVPASIRTLADHPAGVDPRVAAKAPIS